MAFLRSISRITIILLTLNVALAHADSMTWIEYIQSGKTLQAVLDKTSDSFDDSVYSGSSNTDPLGTLKGGETYSFFYRGGQFTCEGYNQHYNKVLSGVYGNADPADNLISLWGRPFVFDGKGLLYDTRYGWVGHLVMTAAPLPSPTAVLSGPWEITCIGGIVFKFDVSLEQSGSQFSGSMIRTNGNEPNTRIDGVINSDGTLDFTRSTGSWRQHYIGRVSQQSGDRAIRLEGKFGNAGQENLDWNAVRK